ncbi:MAG: protein kinase [Nostoc sp.]
MPKEQGAKNEDLAEGSALVGAETHPNVIKVFWMGRIPPEREWYAIEMEYFPSLTLSQLLDQGKQGFVASYKRVLDIYQQVLMGVQHLHQLGMSHGDIKPQNILVSGDQVKLTDFGDLLQRSPILDGSCGNCCQKPSHCLQKSSTSQKICVMSRRDTMVDIAETLIFLRYF